MQPKQAEAIGLGDEALVQSKPSLIYCNVGARGPLAARPGYDPLMQAFGGIMSVLGEEGRPPVRVGPSIIDMGTGMCAVIGILSALHARSTSGRGGVVDVSLFETAAAWNSLLSSQYLASRELPRREGSGAAGIAPYRAYRTTDGDLVAAAGNDSLFRKLCEVLDAHEWIDDARFSSNPLRVANQAALYALIEDAMAKRSTAEWIERLDRAGIPCAPVQTVQQMLEHAKTHALGLLQPLPDSDMQQLGLPIKLR